MMSVCGLQLFGVPGALKCGVNLSKSVNLLQQCIGHHTFYVGIGRTSAVHNLCLNKQNHESCKQEINLLRDVENLHNHNDYISKQNLTYSLGDHGYKYTNSLCQCDSNYNQRRQFHSSCRVSTWDLANWPCPVRKGPPWRVMFFGTDDIAVHTLKLLYTNMKEAGGLVECLDVVTVKDKTPRAVRRYAESVNLSVQEWPVAEHERDRYDVGVLVSFGHLIPDSVIHMFPYGILNMHPSLLPRWRGASPIIHTVLSGDTVTGLSVMEIRPKHFDIGPLLLQKEIRVPYRCTSFQLSEILGALGANMVMECLQDLPRLERNEHEQDSRGVSYAHKIKAEHACVDWAQQTNIEVDCQYRALHGLLQLKTELGGHVVKLLNIVDPHLLSGTLCVRGYSGDIGTAKPGTVAYSQHLDCLVVKCREGLVGFKSVILRKTLKPIDFYNGYLNGRDHVTFKCLNNNLNRYATMKRVPQISKL